MNRFRRTPEDQSGENRAQKPLASSSTSDSGQRSTCPSKTPPFAGSAGSTASFMHGIINRRSSTSNSTGNKALEHGEVRGGGNPAGHSTSSTPGKSTPGFFDKRGHLGFPRHSNDISGGPFSGLGSGVDTRANIPGVHPPKASTTVSKTSQSFSPQMPISTSMPNGASPCAPTNTTGAHEPEPPTTPRFLLGKSSSPARSGKRALSPMTDSSSAERSSVANRISNGNPSELDNETEHASNNRKGTTLVDRGRAGGMRLGVGHHSVAIPGTNGTAPDGRRQVSGNMAATRAQQPVANRTPTARLGSRGFQSIGEDHVSKSPSEEESPQRPCTPVPTPAAPRGPSKAGGSRRSLHANIPSGSSNSTDGDRMASSPRRLNTIVEEYDSFDELSAAEDESFTKAAGDNGMKMLADADDLLIKAFNLLVEMNIEASATPQDGTDAPEDRQRHQKLPQQRREAGPPGQAQRLSLVATHLKFVNESHSPSPQGEATTQRATVEMDPDHKDAMDTSG